MDNNWLPSVSYKYNFYSLLISSAFEFESSFHWLFTKVCTILHVEITVRLYACIWNTLHSYFLTWLPRPTFFFSVFDSGGAWNTSIWGSVGLHIKWTERWLERDYLPTPSRYLLTLLMWRRMTKGRVRSTPQAEAVCSCNSQQTIQTQSKPIIH